jgi:hypothetical protein
MKAEESWEQLAPVASRIDDVMHLYMEGAGRMHLEGAGRMHLEDGGRRLEDRRRDAPVSEAERP